MENGRQFFLVACYISVLRSSMPFWQMSKKMSYILSFPREVLRFYLRLFEIQTCWLLTESWLFVIPIMQIPVSTIKEICMNSCYFIFVLQVRCLWITLAKLNTVIRIKFSFNHQINIFLLVDKNSSGSWTFVPIRAPLTLWLFFMCISAGCGRSFQWSTTMSVCWYAS